MAVTFRTSKIEKFINKRVQLMEMQQRVIEQAKEKGMPVDFLEVNQTVTYNLIFDLCKEFGLEMPIVLGVK